MAHWLLHKRWDQSFFSFFKVMNVSGSVIKMCLYLFQFDYCCTPTYVLPLRFTFLLYWEDVLTYVYWPRRLQVTCLEVGIVSFSMPQFIQKCDLKSYNTLCCTTLNPVSNSAAFLPVSCFRVLGLTKLWEFWVGKGDGSLRPLCTWRKHMLQVTWLQRARCHRFIGVRGSWMQ